MSLSELHRLNQRLKTDKDFLRKFVEVASKEGEYAAIKFVTDHGFDITLDEYALLDKEDHQDGGLTVGKIDRFFIMLSGASPKILGSCPESEQKRQATLGGAVLIPTLFAAIASSIMLATLNVHPFFIVIYALFWMSIVLLMDRALLATYSHASSGWGKIGQFALRSVIAFLMAVTISHPVALKLFNQSISDVYEETLEEKRKELDKRCDTENGSISKLRLKVKDAGKELAPPSPTEITDKLEQCNKESEETKLTNDPEIIQLNKRKVEIPSLIEKSEKEREELLEYSRKEKEGISATGTTGKRGCKPDSSCQVHKNRAKDILIKINELKQEFDGIPTKISNLESQLSKKEKSDKDELTKKCKESVEQAAKEDELRRGQKGQTLKTEYETLSKSYTDEIKSCDSGYEKINIGKPDLITQIEILHGIIYKNGSMAWDKLFIFLSFALLFMAIDMLAIVLKMASAGIYEVKADTMEYANVIRSFSKIRHEAIFQFSKLSEQEQEYLDDLQEGGSKEGLRVNLNTMIDSFNKADAKKLAGFFKRYLSGK